MIKFNDYKNCLLKDEVILKSQQRFISKKHDVYKESINKIALSNFSEGDLDKYEFLTRKDLKYKPNALDKAKFEFSPLGKPFNQGLDKNAENYKE